MERRIKISPLAINATLRHDSYSQCYFVRIFMTITDNSYNWLGLWSLILDLREKFWNCICWRFFFSTLKRSHTVIWFIVSISHLFIYLKFYSFALKWNYDPFSKLRNGIHFINNIFRWIIGITSRVSKIFLKMKRMEDFHLQSNIYFYLYTIYT